MRRFFAYKNPCGAFEVSEERLLRTTAYNLISTEKEPMSRVIYTVEMWSQSWEYRTVQEDTVRESLLDKGYAERRGRLCLQTEASHMLSLLHQHCPSSLAARLDYDRNY